MKKIENPEVRDYLIKFMINQTQKCELFTKVFGKDFARKKLATNLQTVYTNEFNRTIRGYHLLNEPSITLCTSDKDEDTLSIKSLKENKQKLTTMVHEAIHSIMAKNENECKKYKIKYATGILERYEDGTELGRGANEGLTNWICELLGHETDSYIHETGFIKQLELAIGKTRVLKMGKGNISKNISRQLQMSKAKTNAFLAQIDEVYNENDKITQYGEYIYHLKKYINFGELSERDAKETIFELSKLRKHPVIDVIRSSEDYQMFLKLAENPNEYELEYFETLKEQTQNQLKKSVANVESTIFEQYFKKRFQKIIKSYYISTEDFCFFKKISKLMSTDVNDEKMRRYSSYQFLRKFEELAKGRFEDIRSKAKTQYKQGELTFSNFFRLIIETMPLGESELNTIINDVAGMLYEEQKTDFSMLFSYLLDKQQLCAAQQYSILHICKNEQKLPIIMKNCKPQCSSRLYKAKQLQEHEKTEDFIDITISMDEDYKNIINDFNILKSKVYDRDPEARITIVDTAIFVQYKNGVQNIYLINNGRIVLPDKIVSIPVKFQEDRTIISATNKATAFRTKQRIDTSEKVETSVLDKKPKKDKNEINR